MGVVARASQHDSRLSDLTSPSEGSRRKRQLLEAAYDHVAEHGLVDMSLRPLAEAIGSSPRVLLYLFGSKDGLVQALLARARSDELELLRSIDADPGAPPLGIADVAERIWGWLAAPEHRRLLTLWAEGYVRSLIDPTGPWAGFATRTVEDWLAVLADAQPTRRRRTRAGAAERSLVLAVLRGALLDLLATGDGARTTMAVSVQIATLRATSTSPLSARTPARVPPDPRRPHSGRGRAEARRPSGLSSKSSSRAAASW